jgi:hypothetical protein
MRQRREVRGGRQGDEVTSQTQAIQSIADISRSIASRESREVVSREVIEVVMWSLALCHTDNGKEYKS